MKSSSYQIHIESEEWQEPFLKPTELPQTVKDLVALIDQKTQGNYDAIAFSGMSGAVLAGALSLATGKGLIIVRKPNEKTHVENWIEGVSNPRRYIIVDDLIEEGKTLSRIMEHVETHSDDFTTVKNGKLVHAKPECVGIFFFSYGIRYNPHSFEDVPIYYLRDFRKSIHKSLDNSFPYVLGYDHSTQGETLITQ